MDVINPPFCENGPKNKGGRPRGAMTRVKRELREWLRKKPEELAGNIRENALNHPDGFVRLGFSKLWAEYAYGKPLPADGENAAGPAVINVITGVRGENATPMRALLPDGRDPLETHGHAVSGTHVASQGKPINPNRGNMGVENGPISHTQVVDPNSFRGQFEAAMAEDNSPARAENFDGRLTPREKREWAEQQPRDEE